MFKVVWNCSDVFFQVKTNLKHICKVFVRPKYKDLRLFQKFEKIHWIFDSQLCAKWLSADPQLLLNKVPLRMALESLLRILWHFWRYVEYFSEFREAIGMHLEAFWRLLEGFFEVFKKSVANLEICGNFCLTPWRSVSPAKNAFVMPKTVWNCSEVFFQVKTNQKDGHTTEI